MDKHPDGVINKSDIVSRHVLNLPQTLWVRTLVDFYRGSPSQCALSSRKWDMDIWEGS